MPLPAVLIGRSGADAGLAQKLHALVLAQDDRMIGLVLDDLAVNGCITKAPGEAQGAPCP